jgi:hypothetical protein
VVLTVSVNLEYFRVVFASIALAILVKLACCHFLILFKLVLKGQYEDVQENAILEGYRCKNETCDGFLLRTTGMVYDCSKRLVAEKEHYNLLLSINL